MIEAAESSNHPLPSAYSPESNGCKIAKTSKIVDRAKHCFKCARAPMGDPGDNAACS